MDRNVMRLKEQLMDELSEMGQKGISRSNLDTLYKLAVTAEKLCKMEMMSDEEYDDDYSSARGRDSRGRYSRDDRMRMEGESSYNRGSSYARRDGRRYSRDDGDELIEKFKRMMNEADTEKEREALRKCVEYLEMY